MSSVGLSGLSNISNDTLQGRYEKALKQINKLIEINRELKERVGEYEKEIAQNEQQIQALSQANRELDEENNILESKYMELNSHYQQLDMYCKKLEEEVEASHINSQHVDDRIRENEMKYHEELESEMEKYNTLARESEYIQHGYQESLTAIQAKEEEKQELEKVLEEANRENSELKEDNSRLNQLLTDKQIMKTQAQLEQAYKNIDKLMKDCTDLKAKQIDFEVYEEKQKVEKYIGLGTSISEHQGDAVKELIQQYKRKIKELETEKKQVEQKYKHLKLKVSRNSSAQNFQRKIESLQKLTEKQQREIGRIIETYDRELNGLYKDNLKVKQAYITLSQTLARKGQELGEKDRAFTDLKQTTDRISFENESLKRVNYNLMEEKENKLRELSSLKNQIQNTESITIGHLRSTSEQGQEGTNNVKLKVSQVQKGMHTAPPHTFDKEEPFITTSFETKDQAKHKIPITVNYSNPSDKGDFKFIQSVNIINGYHVSVGENSARSNQ